MRYLFKRGSTGQPWFRLNPGITDAPARFGYAQVNGATPGPVIETRSRAAGTARILFQ
jgi:hypothetical protein